MNYIYQYNKSNFYNTFTIFNINTSSIKQDEITSKLNAIKTNTQIDFMLIFETKEEINIYKTTVENECIISNEEELITIKKINVCPIDLAYKYNQLTAETSLYVKDQNNLQKILDYLKAENLKSYIVKDPEVGIMLQNIIIFTLSTIMVFIASLTILIFFYKLKKVNNKKIMHALGYSIKKIHLKQDLGNFIIWLIFTVISLTTNLIIFNYFKVNQISISILILIITMLVIFSFIFAIEIFYNFVLKNNYQIYNKGIILKKFNVVIITICGIIIKVCLFVTLAILIVNITALKNLNYQIKTYQTLENYQKLDVLQRSYLDGNNPGKMPDTDKELIERQQIVNYFENNHQAIYLTSFSVNEEDINNEIKEIYITNPNYIDIITHGIETDTANTIYIPQQLALKEEYIKGLVKDYFEMNYKNTSIGIPRIKIYDPKQMIIPTLNPLQPVNENMILYVDSANGGEQQADLLGFEETYYLHTEHVNEIEDYYKSVNIKMNSQDQLNQFNLFALMYSYINKLQIIIFTCILYFIMILSSYSLIKYALIKSNIDNNEARYSVKFLLGYNLFSIFKGNIILDICDFIIILPIVIIIFYIYDFNILLGVLLIIMIYTCDLLHAYFISKKILKNKIKKVIRGDL